MLKAVFKDLMMSIFQKKLSVILRMNGSDKSYLESGSDRFHQMVIILDREKIDM